MAKPDHTQACTNKSALNAISSPRSTAKTLANGLPHKLKEQETEAGKLRRAADSRQAMILHALTAIRKALLETAKITLGNRCYFRLEVSDWEGWPRMDLKLVDELAAMETRHALTVMAQERQQVGIVQLSLDGEQVLGLLYLSDGAEFEKLPAILKSAIRRFLEVVSRYVSNRAGSHEVPKARTQDLSIEEKEASSLSQTLSTLDLFTEEKDNRDNLVPVGDVQPLDPV